MHRIGWEKKIPNFSSSEIGNFNIGGPVNQLIKKKALGSSAQYFMIRHKTLI
jgi:hypothetical protein